VVGIWIWSRTVGLPIGREPGLPEEIGSAGSISTALEGVILVWTTLLLTPILERREPSRGVVVGSTVFVWTVVILLTPVAIFAAPVGH